MAEGITLLEVSFEPSRGINEMIKAGYAAVLRGLGLSGARKFHAFKVMGENKFVIVAAGDVDRALYELNNQCGDRIRVTSTPLRSFFSFAEKVLGLGRAMMPDEIKDITPGGNLYWLKVEVGHEGVSLEHLKHVWLQDAARSLPGLRRDRLEMTTFKSIVQKDLHMFLKSSPADTDAMPWSQPLWKELGSQIKVSCKPVKHMDLL